MRTFLWETGDESLGAQPPLTPGLQLSSSGNTLSLAFGCGCDHRSPGSYSQVGVYSCSNASRTGVGLGAESRSRALCPHGRNGTDGATGTGSQGERPAPLPSPTPGRPGVLWPWANELTGWFCTRLYLHSTQGSCSSPEPTALSFQGLLTSGWNCFPRMACLLLVCLEKRRAGCTEPSFVFVCSLGPL